MYNTEALQLDHDHACYKKLVCCKCDIRLSLKTSVAWALKMADLRTTLLPQGTHTVTLGLTIAATYIKARLRYQHDGSPCTDLRLATGFACTPEAHFHDILW